MNQIRDMNTGQWRELRSTDLGGGGGGSTSPESIANGNATSPSVPVGPGSNAALMSALLDAQRVPQELPPVAVSITANTQNKIATYNTFRLSLRIIWSLLVPGYLGRGSMASAAGASPVTNVTGTHILVIPPAEQVTLSDSSVVVIPQTVVINGVFANGIPDAGNEYYIWASASGSITVIGSVQ